MSKFQGNEAELFSKLEKEYGFEPWNRYPERESSIGSCEGEMKKSLEPGLPSENHREEIVKMIEIDISRLEVNLAEKDERIRQLEEELANRSSQIEELSRTLSQSQEHIQNASQSVDENETEMSELRVQLLHKEEDNEQLIAQLQEKQAECDVMEEKIHELQQRCSIVSSDSRGDSSEIQQQLTKVVYENETLKMLNETIQSKLNALEEQYAAAMKLNETLSEKSNETQSSVNNNKTKGKKPMDPTKQISELESKMKEMKNAESANKNEIIRYNERIAAYQREQEDLKSRIQELESQNEEFQSMKTTMEERVTELEVKNFNKNQEISALAVKLRKFELGSNSLTKAMSSDECTRDSLALADLFHSTTSDESVTNIITFVGAVYSELQESIPQSQTQTTMDKDKHELQKLKALSLKSSDELKLLLLFLLSRVQSFSREGYRKNEWVDSESTHQCSNCNCAFSISNRKHHCRSCGQVFCSKCTDKTVLIKASMSELRCCDYCYIIFSRCPNVIAELSS